MKALKYSTLLAALLAGALLTLGHYADASQVRNAAAKRQFQKQNPCPATVPHSKTSCPGFIIDHVKPLACGGADAPSNMQWQSVAEAKAKDKWERKDCSVWVNK